mmetsp:Transcript_19723/g.29272  ORF Transcript_19723/g.29272 Transcript_19723/m.29272 type:complete len:122 (-) Transcript_19723:2375-2740(-)
MTPSFRTIMLSAFLIVPSRWAITRTVRSVPRRSRASCTEFSVMVSRAEVASSRMTMGGFLSKHRAIAVRCFSPPESFKPRSPTMLSHPSGNDSTNFVNCAASATSSKSCCVASRLPYRMFS